MSTPERSIAHYRITSKLGEGGMGTVWLATDTKLGRDVAIKILPDSFAADPDRLARFTREAQVLASLNHPNIGAIYGVEERALVLELVAGPTLADRIAQGPVPLDEALPIARQIAEALEYAHEKGIIHRDLKPANVKVTPEGRVKVLDFGLAKALSSDTAAADPASSPTLTMRGTMAGMIMGTAGYMSPEQAKGKPVDRRADIWAFGVVFAEMLTGRALFTGETVSEVLAAVIMKEPPIPESVPPYIRQLLRRCLDRDPSRRLQAIGEARIALENPAVPEPTAPAVAARRPWDGRLPRECWARRWRWRLCPRSIFARRRRSRLRSVFRCRCPRAALSPYPSWRCRRMAGSSRSVPSAKAAASLFYGSARSIPWERAPCRARRAPSFPSGRRTAVSWRFRQTAS